jgi:hypothetical protein
LNGVAGVAVISAEREAVIMAQKDWDGFAGDLTAHVRRYWPALHRGAVLMPCLDESALFALVFANNDHAAPSAAQLEVDTIRQLLREEDMEDLGYGVSQDGRTWTILVRIQGQAYATESGRILQRELLKVRLEEAVQKAWAAVCGGETPALARTV